MPSKAKKVAVSESAGVPVRTDQPRNPRYTDGVPVRTLNVPEQNAGAKDGPSADNQKEKD